MSDDKETETNLEKIAEKRLDAAKSSSDAAAKAAKAAKEAEKAEAEAKVAQAKLEQAKKQADETAQKEYELAAAEAEAKAAATKGKTFSDKHKQEIIFRRELDEPEFFRTKKDLIPMRTILTQDEEQEISRKVEVVMDQTPPYKPEHILSPEYGGISNYELGVQSQKEELEEKLERLRHDPDASAEKIKLLEEDLKTLDYLHENFYIGMNVFRTAKGGRSKLRE